MRPCHQKRPVLLLPLSGCLDNLKTSVSPVVWKLRKCSYSLEENDFLLKVALVLSLHWPMRFPINNPDTLDQVTKPCHLDSEDIGSLPPVLFFLQIKWQLPFPD